AGRRVDRFEIDQRGAYGLALETVRATVFEKFLESEASAAAGAAGFATTVLLGYDLHVDAHQRTHIGGERAVRSCEQNRFEARGDAHDDLLDARIERAAQRIEFAQQRDLRFARKGFDRIDRGIQRTSRRDGERLASAV